ncbi:MAG TPA: hypothetical protein VIO64_05660 [Pseudobacteroides sp.]|uniref:hypothetical protein n=1 Tax=Pseudobacteroides sp. TaxID=1968840 RepID=UPI002F9591EF
MTIETLYVSVSPTFKTLGMASDAIAVHQANHPQSCESFHPHSERIFLASSKAASLITASEFHQGILSQTFRAGEARKGFAVVANEIRRLA